MITSNTKDFKGGITLLFILPVILQLFTVEFVEDVVPGCQSGTIAAVEGRVRTCLAEQSLGHKQAPAPVVDHCNIIHPIGIVVEVAATDQAGILCHQEARQAGIGVAVGQNCVVGIKRVERLKA